MTGGGPAGPAPVRGGVPVGHLSELPHVEAGAIACLRLWCDGAGSQARLWDGLAGALGAAHGKRALGAFEGLVGLIVAHGRRPLMRHHRDCICVGADEAAFAALIAAAADGEREDAMLLAALLVRPGVSPEVVELAGEFGLALRRMALCDSRPIGSAPLQETVH